MDGSSGFQDEVAFAPSGLLTIDLEALSRNFHRLADLTKPARVAAVVKADAYGLGADRVSSRLYVAGCRDFFVAQFGEAALLRPILPEDAKLFVLNGLQPGSERDCAALDIVPVINSFEQWLNWATLASSLRRVLPAVLQFDTGMSRLGIPSEEVAKFAKLVPTEDMVSVPFIMSHLASADEIESVQNSDQFFSMRGVEAQFPGIPVCFSNSGGIFLGSDYHGYMVRGGIAMYGGAPNSLPNPMECVVRLEAAVVQTRTVPAGTKVGYNATYVTDTEMRLATVSAGYADGIPISLSNRGAFHFKGSRLPIVGRVSMDSIIIDVSALPVGALKLGDLVELIGPQQSLEDVARDAGTISYEILTRLGRRYQRRYL